MTHRERIAELTAPEAAPGQGNTMSSRCRIGLSSRPGDPFWVQVFEAIYRTAHEVGVEIVPLQFETPGPPSDEEQRAVVEEILAQELAALVTFVIRPGLVDHILACSIPIVSMNETDVRHPLLVSPQGLYDSGKILGTYLARRMALGGEVLVVGGGDSEPFEDDGRSRLAGLRDALEPPGHFNVQYIACGWHASQTEQRIRQGMQHILAPVDALIGLSDSVALEALEIGRELGRVTPSTLVAGINGDPAVLAAIATGTMVATVETSAAEFGRHVVELACLAAQGLPLPTHFSLAPRLVTAQNVAEVAAQKAMALADLPGRLVGINRQQEQRHLTQLELSLEINRRVGSILSRRRLSHEIADQMRTHFGYDQVLLFLWSEQDQMLVCISQDLGSSSRHIPLAEAGVLRHALVRDEPLFIPDMRQSYRFAPDPDWPRTRSRVVLPVHAGGKQLGLLDLHSERHIEQSPQDLTGLQSLADQLGSAMLNAELYSEAQKARAVAEQAAHLKSRLLANVSHELRTPLNVILGYSHAALGRAQAQAADPITVPRGDLQQIASSGEHLIRLINDLLDLSRAEIDALDLFPEPVTPSAFLQQVFESMAAAARSLEQVSWRLELSEQLPMIEADPLRLRQVLLNLLANADKFTESGEIVLGADVLPPHLHIWVGDTGSGIPLELQERIFEPFVTAAPAGQERAGAGLGLAITRRLVALHGGSMTLESQPGRGSTFHLYLPLTGVRRPGPVAGQSREAAVLLISAQDETPSALAAWARHRGAHIRRLRLLDEPDALLQELQPAALAWDLTDVGQDSWSQIERFRTYQEYFQAPLLLYSRERGIIPNQGFGMTNILAKPLDQQTFLGTIGALRLADARGPILIVDDDAPTREFYSNLISREFPDFPVLAAPNGAVAGAMAAREAPSLVILDLMMPEVDGFEVLARLRQDPQTRQVPVLVLSGRMLSLEDIRRLDYAHVVFQGKEMLSEEEAVAQIRQVMSGSMGLPPQTSLLVKRALVYLYQHYREMLSRQQIAEAVGVNQDYLSRIFQQELGLSPRAYLNRYRILQAKALLRTTSQSITDVALQVGFDSPGYFSRVFRQAVGRSPSAYQQRPD